MDFNPGLKIGETIDNKRLCEIFKCSTQGGMRRSLKTNTLVLVSNHVKSIYDDRWIGERFHYTGMGTIGDQSRSSGQNRTLDQSGTNGVNVHLFEVDRKGEYIYQGPVRLADNPYQEEQPDEEGNNRKVWVFPLELVSGNRVPVSKSEFTVAQQSRERKAKRLDAAELAKRAKAARPKAGQRSVVSVEYERDPHVAAYAKLRANGRCQLCLNPAPFHNKAGEPYLETHHLEWLAKGGEDTPANTVALCPNCHRRMHVLDDPADIEKLRVILNGESHT
ncbi:MAG: HNH endonuclease [Burkholderiaceae bacterium]|nr:HNH endonuclease [Burkholderiaceae bacterium]MCD8517758.1 HNH endonuclease [Burkholderiaceae bacterium]MCD8564232.1 HNH endonuclease [Burkholderiaceae bacterium]